MKYQRVQNTVTIKKTLITSGWPDVEKLQFLEHSNKL